MKKSVMLKWVKALRSGKYRQTRGKLKGKFGYCCLGVLCDISPKGKWNEFGCYDGYQACPPEEVVQWAGLEDRFGRIDFDTPTLADYNDKSKWNFKQIANFIETNWKKL